MRSARCATGDDKAFGSSRVRLFCAKAERAKEIDDQRPMTKFDIRHSTSEILRAFLVLAVVFGVVIMSARVVEAQIAVTAVSPSLAGNDAAVTVTITGTNFVATPIVQIGTTPASSVTWVSSSSLKAVVLPGIPPGTYPVSVTNPDGFTASLPRAFMAVQPGLTYGGFANPTRVAVDSKGNLYVVDPPLGQVALLDPKGVRRGGISGLSPLAIAVDAQGRIYVGDERTRSVRVYDAAGKLLGKLGSGDGQFGRAADVAIDLQTGRTYVVDSLQNAVKVFNADRTFTSQFGGFGTGNGQFNNPAGITLDAVRGEVLVADQGNGRVQIFAPDGTFRTAFPLSYAKGGFGFTAGPARIAGIAVDTDGRIYVADVFQGYILVADRTGAFLGTIGAFGTDPGKLRIPLGALLDSKKRLVVGDWNNSRLSLYLTDAVPARGALPPVVASIIPGKGSQGSLATTIITGDNFATGATVKLVKTGQPESIIEATNVSVVDATTISADLSLAGTAGGLWDVSVTNPDGLSGTLAAAFTVTVPDFALVMYPGTQTIIPGGATSFSMTITPKDGFSAPVSLSLSGPTSTSTISPNPGLPNGYPILSLTTGPDMPVGTYQLVVTGMAGNLVHTASVTLNVVAPAVLNVTSVPDGAKVYLDGTYGFLGNYEGTTPPAGALALEGVVPGRHVVRLTRPDYQDYYVSLGLPSGPSDHTAILVSWKKADLTASGPIALDQGGASTPLSVLGPSRPTAVDWANRGVKDLLVADGDRRLHLFLNAGTDASPAFVDDATYHQVISDLGGTPLDVGAKAVAFVADWNRDGRKDLIVGDDSGKVRLYLNSGTDAAPIFTTFAYLQYTLPGGAAADIQQLAGFAAPLVVDWNGDGRKDLLVGDVNGDVWLYLNTGSDAAPVLAEGQKVSLPVRAVTANATPFMANWDGDGLLDLLQGGGDGKVYLYRNTGTKDAPAFSAGSFSTLKADGVDMDVGFDAAPFVVDWSSRAQYDLLSGSSDGTISLFKGVAKGGKK